MRLLRSGAITAVMAVLLAATLCSQAMAVGPLPSSEYPAMYERVLTLPGASLAAGPAVGAKTLRDQLPVFSIYYVYGRQGGDDGWIQVGATAAGPDGWIPADRTQAWTLMLVMQYAPPGQRKPVVFFEDHAALASIVKADNLPQASARLFADLPDHAPHVVGVEPYGGVTGAVTSASNFYVMPILSAEQAQFNFNGAETTLLQTASIPSTDVPPPPAPPPRAPRIGMVFVIDTTTSMARYISVVREFGNQLFRLLAEKKSRTDIGVGIVAYRNNLQKTPSLQYLTRIFLPLTSGLDNQAVDAAFAKLTEATTSSHSFSEDAFAGLYDGITRFDWDPYDYRLVFLVTDAGALRGNDPYAEHKSVDAITLAAAAKDKKIAIFPMHMRTPEAARAHNIDEAEKQYRELGNTGDPATKKYLGIRGGSVEEFRTSMLSAARVVADHVAAGAANLSIAPISNTAQAGAPDIGALIVNELFSAQMRYVGEQKHTATPRITRAWASDHDLGDTGVVASGTRALDVKILLTRDQLNDLGKHVSLILDAISSIDSSEQKVLSQLQSLSTAMSLDPGRFGGQFDRLAVENILPAYLAKLPYKSAVLKLSPAEWRSMGPTGRVDFTDALRFKLTAYRELEANQSDWHDLGAHERGQQVYALSLDLLP